MKILENCNLGKISFWSALLTWFLIFVKTSVSPIQFGANSIETQLILWTFFIVILVVFFTFGFIDLFRSPKKIFAIMGILLHLPLIVLSSLWLAFLYLLWTTPPTPFRPWGN